MSAAANAAGADGKIERAEDFFERRRTAQQVAILLNASGVVNFFDVSPARHARIDT